MKHPFFNNRILIIYYWLFWLLMGLANTLLQTFWNNLEAEASLLESVTFFILYPILGASIWYLVRYNKAEDSEWLRNILFHLVAASILNAIWLYLSFIVIKTINPAYLQNLYHALPSNVLAGYMMYAGYVIFFFALDYYEKLKEKIQRESELKSLVRDAELSALKSQINPHFLFNSLNSISSLTISDPGKAQEMVINLSTFMRYSLQHNQNETVSLREELGNIKLYLGIEKIRFGKKLIPIFEVEDNCLQTDIPNMILQPLFENAIKYGVYEATNPVTIKLKCCSEQQYTHLIIENDYDQQSTRHKGEGIGLQNIRKRLELIYGNPNLLRITNQETTFKVELMLPKIKNHDRQTKRTNY